jgi:hypothetical protein
MLWLAIVALIGWYGAQILVGILFIALGAHEGMRYRRAIRQIEGGSAPSADAKPAASIALGLPSLGSPTATDTPVMSAEQIAPGEDPLLGPLP